MEQESTRILRAILEELKETKAELRLLRSEMQTKKQPSLASSPSSEEKGKNHSKALDWLTAHKITVKNHRLENAADGVFDQIAGFLGERFHSLAKLHERIRKTLSTGNTFKLSLRSSTQEEIANSTQLCTMLHEYAFLSSYYYNKNSRTISASPQREGRVINFFTGGWFERFAFKKTIAVLNDFRLNYDYLQNPQISLPSGDDFELDLFFLVESKPLWVECKTGDYQSHIVKYSMLRKSLNIDKQKSLLVILGISEQLCSHLSDIHDIVIANEVNIQEKITGMLTSSVL